MRIITIAIAFATLSLSSLPASAQLFFGFGKQPICTQQYQPVCAVRGGSTRTYSNACVARAEGARVVANGPCRRMSRAQAPAPIDATADMPAGAPRSQDSPSITYERSERN